MIDKLTEKINNVFLNSLTIRGICVNILFKKEGINKRCIINYIK